MFYRLLFVQMIGFLGWIILVFSYYKKEVNQVLLFHMIATIFFSVHYYLLGAYSGLCICLIEVLRDFFYYKTDKDHYIFIISLILCFFSGVISVKNLIDFFPIVASLIDGYTLTKNKKTIAVGAIISYSMWVVYNLCVGSISGVFTDGVIVISNIFILLFHFNLFEYLKN